MKIGVLTVTKRPERLDITRRMLEAQSRRPDLWVVKCHGFEEDSEELHDLMMSSVGFRVSGKTIPKESRLATIRNNGFETLVASGCDVIATFDDDDYYSPNYLADLEQTMNEYPHGVIYGMNEYWIGWVPAEEGLAVDGNNIYGRWMSRGGVVKIANQVTWVVDATIAIRAGAWKKYPGLRFGLKPLREDGTEPGGECEAVMAECARLDLPIIARNPAYFCVARLDSADGWGGAHGHTWGPLKPPTEAPPPEPEPAPMSSIESEIFTVGELITKAMIHLTSVVTRSVKPPANSNVIKGELFIFTRRRKAAEKLLPKFLWDVIQEDATLPVGALLFKVHDGSAYHIVKQVSVGQVGE